MSICIRNLGEQTIIDLKNDFLRYSLIKLLKNTLEDLIKSENTNIIINMSHVRSINSILFGIFIGIQCKCRKNGGRMCLFGVHPDLMLIFFIIKLDKYIDIYMNEYDALEQINPLLNRKLRVV